MSDFVNLVDEWVSIWNTYDLSKVEELFLNDGRVSYFSSEKEGAVRGIHALIEHHRDFGFVPGGKQQPNKLWLEDIHIEEYSTCAVVRRSGASSVQTRVFRGGR